MVSIHTLHELEASPPQPKKRKKRGGVSIHTLHELEARMEKPTLMRTALCKFPFIRFTNWKQVHGNPLERQRPRVSIHTLHELEARRREAYLHSLKVSIHTLHELEARIGKGRGDAGINWLIQKFPFIRFTNWKQEKLRQPPSRE